MESESFFGDMTMYTFIYPCLKYRAFVKKVLVAFPLVVLFNGCASLPTDYPRTETTALEDYQSTTIGQRWSIEEAEHPGESAFALLRYGRDAFSIRISMIDQAEKTLDLQVYIWQADETGRILAERLIHAADRGVRVRLLVDDMGLGGTDEGTASMDAHPNIEIRLFNPFATRSFSSLDFLIDLDRVNHRMHNKIMVTDNSFAVVGGRNIGNYYFSVNPDTNFRDLDIMAAGPVVRDISRVFDHFWQGDWAVPIAVLVDRPFSDVDLQEGRARLQEYIAGADYPYSVDDDVAEFLVRGAGRAVWARGGVIWDDPASIEEGEAVSDLVEALRRKTATLQKSLTIESAYFVVGDRGVESTKKLIERGVKVRVLTNSLASNDVLAAHAGHANYRKGLLEAGVDVYELRPDSAIIKKTWKGESQAGLHTKAMVFDDESVFIGSFNLDPRSANINTEAGLYVESPELAARLLAYMEEGVLPKNSYRLILDDAGDLIWVTQNDGVEIRYNKDPLSTFGQRFMSGFIGILPVESQL
jgi:putative cardiolipin synthase